MISDSASRGQSTTVIAVVGTAIIIGGLVLGIAIINGVVPLPSAGIGQSTSVATSTPASVPTTAVPTPTNSSTRAHTRAPTPTPSPISTPTATATPWTTVTTTADRYEEFENAMLFALEEESAVPVRFRGMRVVDDNLVFVVNYTTKSTANISRKKQRSEILVGYAWAIYWYDTDAISGNIPTGMQILEVDNTDREPKYAYVSVNNTRKWLNGEIANTKYKRFVILSIRNQTTEERELVDSIDREWENRTYHNESVPLYPE